MIEMSRDNPTTWAHLQLHALRRVYPGWDIMRGRENGAEVWGAIPRFTITKPMEAAGVKLVIRAPDCHTLAPALSQQQHLAHMFRATTRTT
ncbi:hypothetical protein BKM31_17225 [[Actinomadura] parvosata subsp. kistnae]|uniref:Uncharacterized protein n=2 Tax=Nonomuraea TaxID=83681 RepID=A0A1U9ZYF4_9ACTN|nr:hypothetical protein BKM31_17225 [Nonomuraea sp. ATCC 55076]